MTQLDDLQAYTNLEFPRRSALLTFGITGYDGDPNLGAAPAIIVNSPLGTWYHELTLDVYWRKKDSGSWEESGSGGAFSSIRTGTVVVAVTAGGNDADPTRPERITEGDYTANPFATLAGALDALPLLALPSVYDDPIVVNVEAGLFVGAIIQGFKAPIKIVGTQIPATLTSGIISGTATGGGKQFITDTGGGWTVDDLRGRWVEVTAGLGVGNYVIENNTATEIRIARGPPTFDNTTVYNIRDPGTFFSDYAGGALTSLRIIGCADVSLVNCAVDDTNGGGSGSIWVLNCGTVAISGFYNQTFFGCIINGMNHFEITESYSEYLVGGFGFVSVRNCFEVYGFGIVTDFGQVDSGGATAFGISFTGQYNISGFSSRGGAYGIYLIEVIRGWVATTSIDGAWIGFTIDIGEASVSNTDISNCTNRAIESVRGTLELTGGVSGTGNNGFGALMDRVANLLYSRNAIPTITGTLGELTLDGVTGHTWASVSASGSAIVNPATGGRYYRL